MLADQLAGYTNQLLECNWLGHMRIETSFDRSLSVFFARIGRKCNCRNLAYRGFHRSQASHKLIAIDFRHADITDDQIDAFLFKQLESLFRGTRLNWLCSILF